MIRVMLVDDEPMANTILRHLLKKFPAIEVAGDCTEPEAALEFCAARPVDAVFWISKCPVSKGWSWRTRFAACCRKCGWCS